MSKCVAEATVCRKCKSASLEVSFPVTCIATKPTIFCTKCKISFQAIPASAKLLENPKTAHERNVDYAVNIEYVLGFMAMGDGGCEAQRLLGFLDLPNATTMEKKSFSKIIEKGAWDSFLCGRTDVIDRPGLCRRFPDSR